MLLTSAGTADLRHFNELVSFRKSDYLSSFWVKWIKPWKVKLLFFKCVQFTGRNSFSKRRLKANDKKPSSTKSSRKAQQQLRKHFAYLTNKRHVEMEFLVKRLKQWKKHSHRNPSSLGSCSIAFIIHCMSPMPFSSTKILKLKHTQQHSGWTNSYSFLTSIVKRFARCSWRAHRPSPDLLKACLITFRS